MWFRGVGCYVGSANLSKKALLSNIELGVFFQENEDDSEIFEELQLFFKNLNEYTASITREDVARIRKNMKARDDDPIVKEKGDELKEAKKPYLDEWNKLKKHIFKGTRKPFSTQSNKSLHERWVVEEWKSCHNLLTQYRDVYKAEYTRPTWIDKDVPLFAEMDRIFCWHYDEVTGGKDTINKIRKEHEKNKETADQNIKALFSQWSSLPSCPADYLMDTFEERVPIAKKFLAKDKIKKLTPDEIAQVVHWCYALMDYIDQFKSKVALGISEEEGRLPREEKARRYVDRFLSGTNKHGKTFIDVIYYYIWDDSLEPWEKIWECTDNKSKWKYPGIDRSTLGELIGLARPDDYPIRNNRISRALYALGYDVHCV